MKTLLLTLTLLLSYSAFSKEMVCVAKPSCEETLTKLKKENEELKKRKPQVVVMRQKPKLNRLKVGLGRGMTGLLDKTMDVNDPRAELRYGVVGMVSYDRVVNNSGLSLGLTALTNKTILFTVGQDY